MYDPSPKPEGRLSLRFRKADLSDPIVREVLMLDPLDLDNDESSDYEDDEIDMVEGTLIGDDYVVYRVRRVLSNQTHVACLVIQSEDRDVVVQTERIFTMDTARNLYRQYH
jgi:hypothetical protein